MIFINLKGMDACSAEFDRMSKNSAKIMQYLYDGVYISLPEGDKYETVVPESDYLAIEALYGKKEGKAKREIFQSIVHGYMDYFLNRVDKEDRKIGVTKVLDDSYVNSTTYLFNPSFHAITDDENNPSSWAVDLRKSKESRRLSVLHDERKSGGSYDGSSDGEPHYHITVKI